LHICFTRRLVTSALLKELIVLLVVSLSDRWSRGRRWKDPTRPQILRERSAAPLSYTAIMPHHGLRPGSLLHLLPRVQRDPRLHLLQTTSPPVRALVLSGWRWSTLNGTGVLSSTDFPAGSDLTWARRVRGARGSGPYLGVPYVGWIVPCSLTAERVPCVRQSTLASSQGFQNSAVHPAAGVVDQFSRRIAEGKQKMRKKSSVGRP
jgi:hypothetical protein